MTYRLSVHSMLFSYSWASDISPCQEHWTSGNHDLQHDWCYTWPLSPAWVNRGLCLCCESSRSGLWLPCAMWQWASPVMRIDLLSPGFPSYPRGVKKSQTINPLTLAPACRTGWMHQRDGTATCANLCVGDLHEVLCLRGLSPSSAPLELVWLHTTPQRPQAPMPTKLYEPPPKL